jgi:hypothetical protein
MMSTTDQRQELAALAFFYPALRQPSVSPSEIKRILRDNGIEPTENTVRELSTITDMDVRQAEDAIRRNASDGECHLHSI